MKKQTRNQTRNAQPRSLVIVLLTIAIFSLFGHDLRAQTPTPTPMPTPIPWPTKTPFKPAIDAFTKVLTEAGKNKGFRDELKASCESAKCAVARFTNMKIPPEVFIIFYEGEFIPRPTPTPKATATPDETPKTSVTPAPTPTPTPPRENERTHVFFLPPFNPNQSLQTEYKYEDYLVCCYQYWTE